MHTSKKKKNSNLRKQTNKQKLKPENTANQELRNITVREISEARTTALKRVGTFSWTKLAYPRERGEKSHLSGKEGSVLHDYRQNRGRTERLEKKPEAISMLVLQNHQ